MKSVFQTLREADPALWETFRRKGKEVASPRERQALADGLRLRAACLAARELSASGAQTLALVGGRELAAQLICAGALDGFSGLTLHEAEPAAPLALPGHGPIQTLPLQTACDAGALLVLDESKARGLPPVFAGPMRVVPLLAGQDIPFAVSGYWREAYVQALAGQLATMESGLEGLDPDRTILFAGIYTYFNQGKLSQALRCRGWQTAFLCLNPSNQAHKQGFFDAVLDAGANLELFYGLLAKRRFHAVHFQGWLGLHCFAAAAAALSASPVITEFNDLPQFCFEDEEYDRLFGSGEAAAERRSIGVALARSSGAALNYRQGSAPILLGEYDAAPPLIHLHSWPLPDLFADEPLGPAGKTSLVFCGTLNPSHYPAPPFGDVQLLGLIQELAAQGLDFHVFLNPYQQAGQRGAFWDYEYLARKEPRFVLHPGVGPKELPGAIAGFGWGAMLHRFPPDFTVQEAHMRNLLPTKFFSYLEAGLPVLVSSRIGAVADLVREHGLGLVVEEGELDGLGTAINALGEEGYAALRHNVRRWRVANSLDGILGGLLGLYGGI